MNIRVNLLPEAKLSKVRNKAKKRTFTTITLLVFVVVAVVCVLLVMLRIFLQGTYALGERNMKSLKEEIGKQKDLEENASTLQQNLASFYLLNAKPTDPTAIINNFFKAVPSNVTVSSISFDSAGKVTITGTTDSFADVSRFASSLEQYNVNYLPQPELDRTSVFTNISINSISKSENNKTSFAISFDVNREVLKGQKK